jgi:hypothetical protein
VKRAYRKNFTPKKSAYSKHILGKPHKRFSASFSINSE